MAHLKQCSLNKKTRLGRGKFVSGVQEADVLVHVVDVAHPQASKQAEAVFRILEELRVSEELPMVTAWNKVDSHVDPDVVRRVANTRPDTVAVSGSTGMHNHILTSFV